MAEDKPGILDRTDPRGMSKKRAIYIMLSGFGGLTLIWAVLNFLEVLK